MTRTSRRPITFQRVCDWAHAVLALAGLAAFAVSWMGKAYYMKGFPVLFFLAAALNTLTACLKFRRDGRRKNQKLQGFFFLLFALFMFGMSVVSALCVWR